MEKKNMRGGDAMILMKMIMVVLICGVSAVSLVIMTMMIPCVDAAHKRPDVYIVGDYADGWAPGSNLYKIWKIDRHFYVGDWLFFGYDQTRYNVLVVNETDYNDCSSVNPIENISGGAGKDLFNLSSIQTYYFMSGSSGGIVMDLGSCIRLAVTVEAVAKYVEVPEAPEEPQCPTGTETPEPTPSPPKNVSPSDSGRNVVSTFIGTIAVACTLMWVVVWI